MYKWVFFYEWKIILLKFPKFSEIKKSIDVLTRIAGREYTTAATDQLIGHSIGPVAGYGVSTPLIPMPSICTLLSSFCT